MLVFTSADCVQAWGETSLVRSLHACSPNSGYARYRPSAIYDKSCCLNQVFADYYDVELMEFEDTTGFNEETDEPIFDKPVSRGPRHRDVRQVWIHYDSNHCRPWHPPRGQRPNFRVNMNDTLADRVDTYPWHPFHRNNLTRANLPVRLQSYDTFASRRTRASRAEVDYVLANRNFPHHMPVSQHTRGFMEANWDVERGPNPALPGGFLPTITVRGGPHPHLEDLLTTHRSGRL